MSISDWSESVYCNDDAECREKFGNTLTQCFEVNGAWDGSIKKGICTPVFCQHNNECPDVGNMFKVGVLKGSCDTNSNHCNYQEGLLVA